MFEKIRYDQRYATLPVVIRCRSFAGAARELALTPSAVSAQVRSLERELGVPLFTTVKKELVPTDKCRLVAEYIEKIQSVCRRMSDEVESARSGMERLQVGITPSAENFVLAGVLDAITAANPAVQVRVNGAAGSYRQHEQYQKSKNEQNGPDLPLGRGRTFALHGAPSLFCVAAPWYAPRAAIVRGTQVWYTIAE